MNVNLFLGPSDPSDLYAYVGENLAGEQRRFMCKVCGKAVAGARKDARDHVENSHFPNSFIYTCEYCSAQFKSKMSLRNHKTTRHRENNVTMSNK